jgi:hypothetical protein
MQEITITFTRKEAEAVVRALYVLRATMEERRSPVKIIRTEAARLDVSRAHKKVALALDPPTLPLE